MVKKKETKKQREQRLNTRLDDPYEDIRRAHEKALLTKGVDDLGSASAVATTEEHLTNFKKKDIKELKNYIKLEGSKKMDEIFSWLNLM